MDPLELEADLPPAARHVAHVLQERGACTQRELIEMTGSPPRTVAQALQHLQEAGVVESTPRLTDSRAEVYDLA